MVVRRVVYSCMVTSFSHATAWVTSSKMTWLFEEPLLGGVCTRCEDSFYLHAWQRLLAAMPVLTLFTSDWKPEPTHLSGFQFVYSNVWDKDWDKFYLMLEWGVFLLPCFKKAFKKSNKYLKLCLVSALRMTVNLSLWGVFYKRAKAHGCVWLFWCDCIVSDGKVFGDSPFHLTDFHVEPTSWILIANPAVVTMHCGSWALLSLSVTTNTLSLQRCFWQLDSLMVTFGVTPVQTH